MDYKKIVQRLKSTTVCVADIGEAANAIIDLLKERDALIESVRGICWWCKKSGDFLFSEKTPAIWFECEHMSNEKDEPCGAIGYRCPYWEFELKECMMVGGGQDE